MAAQTVIVGDANLRTVLRRAGSAGLLAIRGALFREAEQIMAKSKRIVPVDTGNLRDSGHVEQPVMGPGSVSVTLAYGGPAAPYAVHVHERLDLRHNPGQFAKYLEFPFLEAVRGMEGRLAAEIGREVERAAG